MSNDLDKLDAIEAAMTPGPWRWGQPGEKPSGMFTLHGAKSPVLDLDASSSCRTLASDTNGIAALRNTYRDLASEIRALRADKASLTAKLAQAKQAGREACLAATHDRDHTTASDIERVLATLEAL